MTDEDGAVPGTCCLRSIGTLGFGVSHACDICEVAQEIAPQAVLDGFHPRPTLWVGAPPEGSSLRPAANLKLCQELACVQFGINCS